VAVFCIVWLDLCRLLSTQWEAREQYAYGWFVPFFAAALLWRRWLDRPLMRPSPFLFPLSGLRCQFVAFSALLLLFLPLRVIYEINTDWPLVSWVYSLIVVAATLYAFYLAGGRLWVRHFAFPVCLILVAVVWPYRIEKGLTQDLMQVVANITVEILGWFNIPAMQRGNLIELASGTVGIDEACSGIRSFQSSLMAGLLIGELYRMKLVHRLALVLWGLALGFCFNVVRTTVLSWQANAHGLHALEKWHDPAGITITIACFFALWASATLITRGSRGQVVGRPAIDCDVRGPMVPWSFSPEVSRFLLAVGTCSLLSILVTEIWYRAHTPKDSGFFYWSVVLPESKPDFQKIELAPRTIKLLKYDLAATGKWRVDDGSEWSVNFFRWQPRSIESVIMSRVHRPEVCLPASGLHQVSKSELIRVEAGDLKLPFRKYTYELDGRNLYVFFCQWEDGAESQGGMQSSGQADRLQSVLKGRRLVGQQTLEIIVNDCSSLDQAEQQLRKDLPAIIQPEKG
jgi:exosortase